MISLIYPGYKKEEIIGEWRKRYNTLYSSPNIVRNLKSRQLRWAGHVVRMEKSRNAYRVLVGKLEGKRPLGRLRCRWEDNIKMDLRRRVVIREIEWLLLKIGTNGGLMYTR